MPPQQPPQPAPQPKGSKISNAEWGLVIGAAIVIDIVQLLLDFLAGVGIVLNRFIDIVVGASLALYFKVRGVKMDSKKTLSLVGAFLFEMVPVADVLPLWSLDVVMTMLWDKADKKGLGLPI